MCSSVQRCVVNPAIFAVLEDAKKIDRAKHAVFLVKMVSSAVASTIVYVLSAASVLWWYRGQTWGLM